MARSRLIQGQSGDATEIKQRGLSFAFRIGLTVAVRRFPQFRYFHFDLNAGSGFNEEAGCIGSPLAFLNEAALVGCRRFFAGFCDREDDQVRALLSRPELDDRHCRVFHCDNADLLSIAPDIVAACKENRRFAIGSVLSDPNGCDVPIDDIAQLASVLPRFDTIFHWNSTITKRLRYGIKPAQIMLADVPRLVPKQHWLIREPVGPHQFTMLIGRNMRSNDYKALGFFHLDSERGQHIMEKCSVSDRERFARQQQALL